MSPATEEEKEIVEKEINYFEKNKERMRYKTFRQQELFIGSGVAEAANKIIALRCCILSNSWEDFRDYRAS
jgi:hypothetical protein